MDELNSCRKDSSIIIKEKHINLFEPFLVYGLAKIQRGPFIVYCFFWHDLDPRYAN